MFIKDPLGLLWEGNTDVNLKWNRIKIQTFVNLSPSAGDKQKRVRKIYRTVRLVKAYISFVQITSYVVDK